MISMKSSITSLSTHVYMNFYFYVIAPSLAVWTITRYINYTYHNNIMYL